MDNSRLSSSDTYRSSVPNDTSIQVLSHLSDSEDQLTDHHNENHETYQDAGSQPEPEVSVSMLDRLRAPILSDLARKRKVQSNPPVGMKPSKKGSNSAFSPKSITPYDRVKEHPGEPLTVSTGKLFCSACKEQLSVKSQVLKLHMKSAKHQKGKERLKTNEKQEMDISKALQEYSSKHHPVGEKLPESTRIYRVKVVTAFLKAGVPLSKVDSFRDIFEEHAFSLCDSSKLRQLIPFILDKEIQDLKRAIEGKSVAVIFDGTTHICEAMVVVLRYVDDDWQIKQQVCRLMLVAKSMTGEEVAHQLIAALSTELSIQANHVVAFMRDRASVNNVAMRTVSVLYNSMIDIGCFSHTLDHVGENMNTPILNEFTKHWISLFSHSPKVRLAWRSRTGFSSPSYCATRWWSRFEVIHQMHNRFGDVSAFLRENTDLPAVTTKKMVDVLNNPPEYRKLIMELTMTVDGMEAFVKATYALEGDGVLSLVAYERISALHSHIVVSHHPNVTAAAKRLANGSTTNEQILLTYAENCVKPAYDYFREKFDNELRSTVELFKTARYFSPSKVSELKPTTSDLSSLSAFPCFDSEAIEGMKSELPKYLATAEDVSPQIDTCEWWKHHSADIPTWAMAFRKVALIQPSSAAAERVFSLLQSSFGKQQEQSLEDYVQLSVMMQYNYRK